MKKRTTEYKITVSIVDDTYWDDGSRFTRRTFYCKNKKEALTLREKFLKEGVEFKSTVTHEKGHDYPDKNGVKIYKITTTDISDEPR
jgi:sialic acid synthase SpsE